MALFDTLRSRVGSDKEKKVQIKTTREYTVFLILFLVVTAFFLTSGMWLPTKDKVDHADIGTKGNPNDSMTLTVVDWQYNPTTRYLELTLNMQSKTVIPEFFINAFTASAKNKAIPVEVAYMESDMLILRIEHLPKDWNTLSIWIQENSATLDNIEQEKTTKPQLKAGVRFYANEKSVSINTSLSPRSPGEYLIETTAKNIENVELEIEKIKETIQINNQKITKLSSEIELLEKQKMYQTQDEIDSSNAEIKKRETDIGTLEKETTMLQQDISNLERKIEMLRLKLLDKSMKKEDKSVN